MERNIVDNATPSTTTVSQVRQVSQIMSQMEKNRKKFDGQMAEEGVAIFRTSQFSEKCGSCNRQDMPVPRMNSTLHRFSGLPWQVPDMQRTGQGKKRQKMISD
jgi:hypothetical protein